MSIFQVDNAPAERADRALLVSVVSARHDGPDAADELQQLVISAGLAVAGHVTVRRQRPDPAHYVGSGKVEELGALAAAAGAGLVVFDVDLSPAQQRNLERTLKLWVIDRTALILDIFSQRARSNEGKLQVELAQLQHLSTRLVRGWSHLERQRGGLGKTGGPGEKQIEIDRRLIGMRIKRLRQRLSLLERQRHTRRRARGRSDVLKVSLVGYTNAGKSTLFNALTGASVLAADQLFATLDTTARKCFLGDGSNAVVTDTVGFIRGLPHALVAAFKSTLDETGEADLLLHVVDAASPARDEQMAAVDRVLAEIGASEVPCIVVYNKLDVAGRPPEVVRDPCDTIVSVSVSAKTGAGVDMLREAIALHAQRLREPDSPGDNPLWARAAAAQGDSPRPNPMLNFTSITDPQCL